MSLLVGTKFSTGAGSDSEMGRKNLPTKIVVVKHWTAPRHPQLTRTYAREPAKSVSYALLMRTEEPLAGHASRPADVP